MKTGEPQNFSKATVQSLELYDIFVNSIAFYCSLLSCLIWTWYQIVLQVVLAGCDLLEDYFVIHILKLNILHMDAFNNNSGKLKLFSLK